MGNIFYTSDLHIGHKLVSGLRGFWDEDNMTPTGRFKHGEEIIDVAQDTNSHDAWLAAIWDSTVRSQDQVYILGDISINGGQHALDWIGERPGIKHLIAGNHDPVHPMDRRAAQRLPLWSQYFETIQPFMRRKLEGRNFLLSHFPYWSWGDGPGRPEARYEQYRLPDLGLPLLHGHTHGTEREHGNMLHVGVDAWEGQLVPQQTVHEWLLSLT